MTDLLLSDPELATAAAAPPERAFRAYDRPQIAPASWPAAAPGAGLYRSFAKRLFDLMLALALLPLLAPVIAALWLGVRRDGGPGFFLQDRVGRHGRHFRLIKLRTMRVDAEAHLRHMIETDPEIAREWLVNQKLAHDVRVTRFGRLLRATSLDELPQIFNVLLGDMSFVGPRPFLTEQEAIYRADGGRAYFALRPGITGEWQIEGRGKTSFVSRVLYDERYGRRCTLAHDLVLLAKTARVVLARTGH